MFGSTVLVDLDIILFWFYIFKFTAFFKRDKTFLFGSITVKIIIKILK